MLFSINQILRCTAMFAETFGVKWCRTFDTQPISLSCNAFTIAINPNYKDDTLHIPSMQLHRGLEYINSSLFNCFENSVLDFKGCLTDFNIKNTIKKARSWTKLPAKILFVNCIFLIVLCGWCKKWTNVFDLTYYNLILNSNVIFSMHRNFCLSEIERSYRTWVTWDVILLKLLNYS